MLILIVARSAKKTEKFHLRTEDFALIFNFTCAAAKDEFERHPEMRTILLAELEHSFPSDFSQEILKCLPSYVAKIILNPHTNVIKNESMKLPKETMVIFVADKIEKVS